MKQLSRDATIYESIECNLTGQDIEKIAKFLSEEIIGMEYRESSNIYFWNGITGASIQLANPNARVTITSKVVNTRY